MRTGLTVEKLRRARALFDRRAVDVPEGLSHQADWAAWLATLPASVQALAAEFPLGTTVVLEGVCHFLLGYTEGNMLLVSPIDPGENYEGAVMQQIALCAEHCRPQEHAL